MKKGIIYLALIGVVLLTTSMQYMKGNTNEIKMLKSEIFENDTTENEGFVDESLEKYAEYDTKEKLYAAFGEENIREETWTPKNGDTHRASELTDPRNGKVYNYVWSKDGKSLYMIEAYYRVSSKANKNKERQRQIIDFRNGIYTGMTVANLEEWNGAPFAFSGLKRDKGGFVNFGKFADKRIIVRLGFDKSISSEVPASIKNSEFVTSNATALDDLPLFVDYIALKVK